VLKNKFILAERVAIKVLDKNKLDSKTRKMLDKEIDTLETMHHPNIIRQVGE